MVESAAVIAQRELLRDVNALIAQRLEHVPPGCGWADYQIDAIRGDGDRDEAVYALGFRFEQFGSQDTQPVSCTECGGIFRDHIGFMIRHRLKCGWNGSL